MYKVVCPYCHSDANLHLSSAIVYGGRDYGPIYLCNNYPSCDSYVGCHPDSVEPLGRLANGELRRWKNQAHKYFDRLWKEKKINEMMEFIPKTSTRSKAYLWLSRQMGLPQDKTHIGMFNVNQCKRVVELCKPYLDE